MDIAYVSDVMSPWRKGGAEKRIYEVSKRLARNHEVTIYTMKWWEKPQKKIQRNDIDFVAISEPKKLYVNNKRSIREAFSFALSSLKVPKKHDLIDFNAFPYIPLFSGKIKTLRKNDPELVATWHEVWGDYWYKYLGKKGFFGKTIEKWAAKQPDQIISVSERTQRELKKLLVDSKVIPNGINYNEIEQINEDKQKYDVSYVGRLIPEKNVDVLLEALKNTDFKAAIVGDGPQKQELKKIIKKEELDVDLFDQANYKKLIGILKSSKTFVLPSSREGFGITVLEAMASGTPVLTVDEEKNAAKDLISNDKGLIVPLDSYQIKMGIKNLIQKNKEKEISKNAKEFAKNYTWDKVAEKTERIYEETLE